MLGQSDGIIFKNITEEDLNTLINLARKYNKQTNVIRITDIEVIEQPKEEVHEETLIIDKRKIRKLFVTNGKETIKILPEELDNYIQKGYRRGRKK